MKEVLSKKYLQLQKISQSLSTTSNRGAFTFRDPVLNLAISTSSNELFPKDIRMNRYRRYVIFNNVVAVFILMIRCKLEIVRSRLSQ